MALPINIEDLINGHSVEWDRLEFKKGWNPESVIHTICAFANDMNNWGGGYIIIGIEAQSGQPVFPPHGLDINELDSIQGELIEICHQIQPDFSPISQPEVFQNKHIFIIWVPAGDNRPYTAPKTLSKRSERVPYIRLGSRTVIARGDNLRRLQELTARIPFDDRINQHASIDDFDLSLIQAYLKEVKSGLFDESRQIPFGQLCRQMGIARGSDEYLRPINIGLLFFNDQPEKFFNRAQIEVVIHQDDSGTNFAEKIFKGPLHKQLKDALDYINNIVISQQVRKVEDRPEALRFNNYPFAAIEEALANAVYHKSYEEPSPIEVQVFLNKINVLSYPGPLPPIDEEALKKRVIEVRQYRNRRIGDYLKDMDLTEGRGTGFPKIYKSLENNGSPSPEFKTDKDKTYFLTTILIHPLFKVNDQVSDQVKIPDEYLNINKIGDVNRLLDYLILIKSDQVSDQVSDRVNEKIENILGFTSKPKKSKEILNSIGLKSHTDNYKKYIEPCINLGWLSMTIPDKPQSRSQKYLTTEKGKLLLTILKYNSNKN